MGASAARHRLGRALLIALLATPALAPVTPVGAALGENPIVLENRQPGSTGWRIAEPGSGFRVADDVYGQIKGYASATSVDKGEEITLFVSVNPAQTYSVDVYRLGWYAGAGGRLLHHAGDLAGTPQDSCPVEATSGLIECAWAPAIRLTVPSTWTTGIYLAVLTNASGFQNSVPFVVRDDARPAAILYQLPFLTYQAYNNYPNDGVNGKSLYAWSSFGAPTLSGTRAAVRVSFDRPYRGNGDGGLLQYDQPFAAWAEQMGYDVGYASNIDLHQGHAGVAGHRAILSVGHDEYWTRPMYDAATAFRDAGVHLAFFGANNVYMQVRLEPSITGVADRVVVCYRDASIDPVPDETLKTVRWRDAPLNRPEQQLVGIQYTSMILGSAPYVVEGARHWIYTGAALAEGEQIGGMVTGEGDRYVEGVAGPPAVEQTFLSRSSYTTRYGGTDYTNSSLYRTAGGALVFAAGTFSWANGLGGPGAVDRRIQQITQNLLDRFVGKARGQPCAMQGNGPGSTALARRGPCRPL